MKSATIAMMAMLAICGDAFAANVGIQGGIATTDKAGLPVFYNFETGDVIPLMNEAVTKDSFDISEDGTIMIRARKNELSAKKFPSSDFQVVTRTKISSVEKPMDQLAPLTLKNLRLSADGKYFTYEYKREMFSPFEEKFFDAADFAPLGADLTTQRPWLMGFEGSAATPEEMQRMVHGEASKTERFKSARRGGPCQWAGPWHSQLIVPEAYIRRNGEGIYPFPGKFTLPLKERGMLYKQTKNAHFVAHSKDGGAHAFIYRTEQNGCSVWGPVEIRSNLGATKDKPGFYQINLQFNGQYGLPNCYGLAWTPGGDITLLTDGGDGSQNNSSAGNGVVSSGYPNKSFALLMISRKDIADVYQKSGIVKNPEFGGPRYTPGSNVADLGTTVEFCPYNYIGNSELQKIDEIHGKDVCWVRDKAFLYLGNDNGLYLREAGYSQLAIKSLPGGFYKYCRNAPDIRNQADTVAQKAIEMEGYVCSVGMKVMQDNNVMLTGASFDIAGIELQWDFEQGGAFLIPAGVGFQISEGGLEKVDISSAKFATNSGRTGKWKRVPPGNVLILRQRAGGTYRYVAVEPGNITPVSGRANLMQVECRWIAWDPARGPIRVADKRKDLAQARPR